MTEKELISWGFTKLSNGFEFRIKQYGGYSDFVYYSPKENRLVIQYKMNQVEIYNCDRKRINRALSLVGLNTIDKLVKEDEK